MLHSVPQTRKSSFPSQRTLLTLDPDCVSTLLMTYVAPGCAGSVYSASFTEEPVLTTGGADEGPG